MNFLPVGSFFHFQVLGLYIFLFFGCSIIVRGAENIQFNEDVLDVNDRENIDLSQFSQGDFIMPGTYSMVIHVNKATLPESEVAFLPVENNPKSSEPCLSPALIALLGLKENANQALTWTHDSQCVDLQSLKGTEIRGDLATSSLYISIPQAYLEYMSDNWDPASRWDSGIPGILFDYNLYGLTQKNQQNKSNNYSLSGTGTTGANIGEWRLRADWQLRYKHQENTNPATEKKLDWSRYYAYRALPTIRSKLIIGEDYLSSGVFDSFRFTGASLQSDDNMLPPNLRGYAPEVTGVAKTNAKVTISQQGRVLYETQVPSGPFSIHDLSDTVSGELKVRVEEQGGSIQEFTVNTASVPYLTRPGMVRFKLSTGKPTDWQHRSRGPLFGSGEYSWGVSNGWSLYGGVLGAGDYNAMSLGLGRDLLALGALSFDLTQSLARLPQEEKRKKGRSYRFSYSKSFEEYNSQVTFAGYRFSQKDFMSMDEYLDSRYGEGRSGNNKEMYTISLNKSFRDSSISAFLNYSHQTYWNRSANDRYSLMLSRYFSIGRFKNLNMSLSAYRTRYNERNDDGMYLSLSVPWGEDGVVSYNGMMDRNNISQSMSYYRRLNEHDNYQLTAGHTRKGVDVNSYYSHEGDMARVTANAAYQEAGYTSFGMSAQGGMTLTTKGGALHRVGTNGGTRLLLDTEGVENVPVQGYGSTVKTNAFGKAVVADINSYYRSRASIDVNNLADNAEATNSVVQATLTEGAIGYRRFNVIAGAKAMAIIKLSDGTVPPFGAIVLNHRKQGTGLVNDSGSVYLSGINPGEIMTVNWNGKAQCEVRMPKPLPEDMLANIILLPCEANKQKIVTEITDAK